MGGAAVFGAGAAVHAGFGRLEDQFVDPSRNHVELAAKRGNPERVDHVRAAQAKKRPLAHRQADFVGQFDRLAVRRQVAHPPPPLLARDLDACGGLAPGRTQFGHQRQAVGQQGAEHQGGKDRTAADDQPARGPHVVLGRAQAGDIQGEADHQGPDQQADGGHPPEQFGHASSFDPGGAQARLWAAAGAAQAEGGHDQATSACAREPRPAPGPKGCAHLLTP